MNVFHGHNPRAEPKLGRGDGDLPRQRSSWQALNVSVRGASHVNQGIVCQDFSDQRRFGSGNWAGAAVADGHGSPPHFRSDRGARLAVDVLMEQFASFVKRASDDSSEAAPQDGQASWKDRAAKHLVPVWRSRIYSDLLEDPPAVPSKHSGEPAIVRYFDDVASEHDYERLATLIDQFRDFKQHASQDTLGGFPPPARSAASDSTGPKGRLGRWQTSAYGTTLLGVLVGPESLHWVQQGDGAIASVIHGQAELLVPPSTEAIANQTPSLCDDDADRKLVAGSKSLGTDDVPSAVVLVTDGVPNSYTEPEGFLQFCQDIVQQAASGDQLRADLQRWLPEISARGSGDDMSVAVVWRTQTAPLPTRPLAWDVPRANATQTRAAQPETEAAPEPKQAAASNDVGPSAPGEETC